MLHPAPQDRIVVAPWTFGRRGVGAAAVYSSESFSLGIRIR